MLISSINIVLFQEFYQQLFHILWQQALRIGIQWCYEYTKADPDVR